MKSDGSSVDRATAIALFRGELLPGDLNEPWAEESRNRLLGERYEYATELASPGADDATRATGLRLLEELGAHATVRALARH